MRAWIAVPLLLASALAWAQVPTLEQADTDWSRLRLQGDASALAALLAEDWLLPRSDGRVQHRTGYLQGQELATRTRIDNADVQVRRYGDTAVITGTRVQAATRNSQPREGRLRFTCVSALRDGHWQRLSSHSSRLSGPGPDGDDRRASVADQNSSPCGEAFFGGSGGTKRLQSSHGHCSREALKPRRLLASAKRRASSCAYTPSPRMRLPNWLS